MPNGTVCASYSPISEDIVINANTYRAAVLLGAFELSGDNKYKIVAEKNIAFWAFKKHYELTNNEESKKIAISIADFALKDLNEIPDALDKSIELAEDLINHFQTSKGHFITRVTSFGTIHKVPYLRWPQAQLFYALTSLLKELEK